MASEMKPVLVHKDYWKRHIEIRTAWWSPETPACWLKELNEASGLRPSEIRQRKIDERERRRIEYERPVKGGYREFNPFDISDDESDDEDFNPFNISDDDSDDDE